MDVCATHSPALSAEYVWDRAEREAAAMRRLTQAELCAWAKHALLREDAKVLSIHAHDGSVANPDEQPPPPAAVPVGVPTAWKAGLPVSRQADLSLPPVDDRGL